MLCSSLKEGLTSKPKISEKTPSSRKSVIIIGGGISGLAAGSHLVKSGRFEVILLEAADRIGGRVWSVKFGDHFVENGAQWVHGEVGNSIFNLASPFGLLENDKVTRESNQKIINVTQRGVFLDREVNSKLCAFERKLNLDFTDEIFQRDEPFGNFANRTFQEFNAKELIHEDEGIRDGLLDYIHRLDNNVQGTDNWFQQSCQGRLDYKECEGEQRITWRNPFCYKSIFDLILKGQPSKNSDAQLLPDWIRLNRKVVNIEYSLTDDKQVKISCEDGSEFCADHLICTVSVGVLKAEADSLFKPNLPHEKLLAIQNTGFGAVNKIFLEFDHAWWPSNLLRFNLIWDDCKSVIDFQVKASDEELLQEIDGIPIWCRGLLGFYSNPSHPTALLTWIMGPCASLMEKLEPTTVESAIISVLHRFLGQTYRIPKPLRFSRTTWFSNPLTRGSYSFRSIDSSTYKPEVLSQPLSNATTGKPIICFAGEATHPYHFSTVHGAYDSGIREANRLINFYDQKIS